MPNDQDVAKAVVEEILANEWTWRSIASALGKGAVGGVAGWAIGFLLNYALGKGEDVEGLLAKLKNELLRELPELVAEELREIVREDNLRDLSVVTNAVGREVDTDPAGTHTERIEDAWREINQAEEDARSLKFPAFGIYLVVLHVNLTTSELLTRMPPYEAHVDPTAFHKQHYRNFRDALQRGWDHTLALRSWHKQTVTSQLVRLERWSYPQVLIVMVFRDGAWQDAGMFEWEDLRLAESELARQRHLLDQDADDRIFFPALRALGDYYRWLDAIRRRLFILSVAGTGPHDQM